MEYALAEWYRNMSRFADRDLLCKPTRSPTVPQTVAGTKWTRKGLTSDLYLTRRTPSSSAPLERRVEFMLVLLVRLGVTDYGRLRHDEAVI
jgi:hypothetical protein